jgi:uncharacterized membrane protein (UPF0136 family)
MLLFAVTIFLGAFLLFQVQPLIGKQVLPWYGGGAGVWTVCLLFFQLALLAGYGYAHALAEYVRPRRQATLHAVVLLGSLALLPILPRAAWKPTGAEAPTAHLLLLLVAHIGVPFVLLASTGPLLQRWFSQTYADRSPYRLYALSNAASLLALLTYPVVFEPTVALPAQGRLWGIAYACYALLGVAVAWRFHRVAPGVGPAPTAALTGAAPRAGRKTGKDVNATDAAPPTVGTMALWLGLTATASALLMATTNRVCQDLTVVPLLWVVPLAIYLTTFILVFDHERWYDRRAFVPLLVIGIVVIAYVMHHDKTINIWAQVAVYMTALFVFCMVCHGELVRTKPAASYLTRFYLMVAAGGALGGVFVALIAPLVFAGYWEFHLAVWTVFALALGRWWWLWRPRLSPGWRWGTLAATAAANIALAASLLAVILHERPGLVEAARDFYGVLRIYKRSYGPYGDAYEMYHGTTLHGRQMIDPRYSNLLAGYFGRESGVGIAIQDYPPASGDGDTRPNLRIGIVGLGTGTIARYARPGDHVRFYEINPAVDRLCRKYFHYFPEGVDVQTVLGDARILMEREVARGENQRFDVLAVDAFNSDSIPVHLLTREAFELYWRELKDDGVLTIHVSNQWLDLAPVVAGLARESGRQFVYIWNPEESRQGILEARWCLVTKNKRFLDSAGVRLARGSEELAETRAVVWTDDDASIWSVLHRAEGMPRWALAPQSGRFVIDRAPLLTMEEQHRLLVKCRSFYEANAGRRALFVVTIDSLASETRPGVTFGAYALQLFRDLKIDHIGDGRNALLLFAMRDQRYTIFLGPGWEASARPRAQQIMNDVILPAFQQKRFLEGLSEGVDRIEALTAEASAAR